LFSIFKRKSADDADGLAGLVCDMHSHLIPGIDDGVKTLDASIGLVRGLMELGYRKIITTPHINADIFPNTPEIIKKGQADVRAELARQGLEVEFSAAAEYLLDDHFYRLLTEGEQLLTLKDNMVLIELSFAVPAINLKEKCRLLSSQHLLDERNMSLTRLGQFDLNVAPTFDHTDCLDIGKSLLVRRIFFNHRIKIVVVLRHIRGIGVVSLGPFALVEVWMTQRALHGRSQRGLIVDHQDSHRPWQDTMTR